MTDEGRLGEPMDVVEACNAMANMATVVRALYQGLRAEEFSDREALELCAAYLRGIASGGKA